MTEPLIDQIPPLLDLKQFLTNLSFQNVLINDKKPLIMETIPEIKSNILKKCFKKWKKITKKQVELMFFPKKETLMEIGKRYLILPLFLLILKGFFFFYSNFYFKGWVKLMMLIILKKFFPRDRYVPIVVMLLAKDVLVVKMNGTADVNARLKDGRNTKWYAVSCLVKMKNDDFSDVCVIRKIF